MCRLLSLALAIASLVAQEPTALAPCDAGLDTASAPQAIFVRMRDQLFARGDAYPAFCAEHAKTPRSELRKQTLGDLRARAKTAWEKVGVAVGQLERAGELRRLERFWIINGFAADASAEAVRALRALPEVAYVHRQTQPGDPQQQLDARGRRWLAERAQDEARALELLAQRGAEAEFAVDGAEIPWNLRRVGADAAWRLRATGQGVVIAMLDSGVLCLEPLVHALWRNPGEEPNGKDDDGNGYVDDLFGWDFAGNTRFVVGDGQQSHGTMCGGILAGRPWGEPKTITGVAPRASLMVLRGMGKLRAYEYAAAMGADVLSMSYMWVNVELGSYRSVFRTAHEHLAACGVVAVGGAGNFARTAPAGRQITLPKDIPCVIAAAGLARNGEIAGFSSRGPCTWDDVPFFNDHPADAPLLKPDVTACAAGFPVWHWTQSRGREVQVLWRSGEMGLIVGPQGNSFAGPHAGGAAALVLSANRELTPWRVQSILTETCEDLGEPGRDATYGAGLLRLDAAVRAATEPPR